MVLPCPPFVLFGSSGRPFFFSGGVTMLAEILVQVPHFY
jgi:hypothetical protein